MKFYASGYYMHKNAMDVAISVIHVAYQDDKKAKLKIDYINLGCTGRPWTMLRLNNFVINATEFSNWIPLRDTQVFTPRKKPGLPDPV